MRKRVLLIGTDEYVMRACVRHAVPAVVVQSSSAYDEQVAEIPDDFDVVRVDDYANAEAIMASLHRSDLVDEQFAAVYTAWEPAIVTAGLVASHFGCRGIDPTTGLLFRDKALQKRRISRAGIPTARTVVIDDIHDVAGLRELPFERGVLKPIAGSGTKNTSVVYGMADLHARSTDFRARHISQRTFLVEEFVPGDEWVADGVMFEGELLFLALGKYGSPCIDTVSKNLPLWMRRFDRITESSVYEMTEPVVRQALSVLGFRDGVFHMELFHDPATDRLMFGECAARRGGGLIPEELSAKFNVDVGECALLCAVGVRPELVVKHRTDTIGWTHLLSRPGTLLACPTPAELMRLPDVEFARVDYAYGRRFSADLSSTSQRLGQVLVAAGSEKQLVGRFGEIRDWFDERLLTVPPDATNRELYGWQRRNWPDAVFGGMSST